MTQVLAVAALHERGPALEHRQHAAGEPADRWRRAATRPSRTARSRRSAGPRAPRARAAAPRRCVIEVKNAHVSNRPKRARSCPPVTRVRPRLPITSASTIRGELPRCTTSMPRNLPLTSEPSLRSALRERHPDRAPAVARRGVVVGVVDGLQPRLRLVAQRRVLDVLGASARGGEEVGDDRRAVVGDDLAARLGDRLVGRGLLGRDAAVDLRARVGVEVEAGARLHRRDRVGARRHGLRLQRLDRPRRRRLVRHHAAQVGVERERVDRVDAGERARG